MDKAELNKKIEEFISNHEQSMVNDLIKIIAIPSIRGKASGNHPFGSEVARALDYALELAGNFGFETENNNYYYGSCTLRGNSGDKCIGIVCHSDVVPADGEGWTRPPFEGYLNKDNYIVGRGSSDNKGPLIAALYVLRFFREYGVVLDNDLRLIFGCDEESGMEDMKYLNKSDKRVPDFVLVPDAPFPVCYAEKGRFNFAAEIPTVGNIVEITSGEALNSTSGKAGILLGNVTLSAVRQTLGTADCKITAEQGGIRIETTGVSKHIATPEGSEDALNKLLHLICDASSELLTTPAKAVVESLIRFTDSNYGEGFGIAFTDPVLGRLTEVCSVVRTENGLIKLNFDARYPAGANFDVMRDSVINTLKKEGFSPCGISNNAPNYVNPNTKLVKELAKIANEQMHTDLVPVSMGGGTYARKLPRAIGYGPSRPDIEKPFPKGQGWGHQANEGVRLENLTDMIRVYIPALIMLDQKIKETNFMEEI